ncbi:step II splicing factor slu7 [Babesia gibsoni]|uniref:Pre-mRNA-splicing factor SLU7 n=1 Tax=Babesia gibsoni TaxID=33632 RepID=A0AAD8LI37_BABGI|nr:step II splicing factor slu7 [Babesia gibsoni]
MADRGSTSHEDQGGGDPQHDGGGGVNPYIPKFISKAPWYMKSTSDLQHQRLAEQEKTGLDSHHRRGVTSQVAIKYRKNACENCGAMTHDAKSCVERPRKKGAKYTSTDICPDEYIVQNASGSYDAVRDRWAGFDPESHRLLVETYQAAEEERERRKIRKITENLMLEAAGGSATNAEGDKDKQPPAREVTFDTKDDSTRTTTRNLRIRDDTAKYLINLDVDSAYYDPKSRSLRDDPLLGMNDTGIHTFRGDNEMFTSGDTSKPKEMEVFAWEAQQRGVDVKFMAQPTQLEFLYKEQRELREKEKEANRKALLERFGGSQFLDETKESEKPTSDQEGDDKLPPVASERTRVMMSSKYEEDIFTLGHSAVWGSYYDRDNSRWGYKCCKCTTRDMKCTSN